MGVRSVENTGLVRVGGLEQKGGGTGWGFKTRGARGTIWFPFINQLRLREDCSFPKDC